MQNAYLSLFYSTSSKPLEYWSKEKSKTGSIKRFLDQELNENVLEIQDVEESNCQKTWIMCPPETQQVLDIKLPFLVMVIYNMNKQCFFQLQIADKDNVRHLINFSNYEIKKNSTLKSIPPRVHLILKQGWNRLEINLNHLSTKIFDAQFEALCRLKLCGNFRVRRIYSIDNSYENDELSAELFQGFLDNYMAKWGIQGIERSSQTKKTFRNVTISKETLRPMLGFGRLFLKNLQAKSERVIDDFFAKRSIKSMKDYLEFKRKARIKPYVIPESVNKLNSFFKKKPSESSLVDLAEIKKSFLRENYIFTKIAFEESRKMTPQKPEEKKDSKYSVYKVRKYKYPELTDKKVFVEKNEKQSKLSSFSKFKQSTQITK